ncbi:MAG: acetyl-CoA hydrolase, partial [Candidatus Bipolaricaulota bacterium]|nr:acetyl-CoA hydrolase [Candidatus Bipolaricaulota bacterium]
MPLRSLALADWRERYPEKFAPEETIFSKIRRGHHIFISTGCGEPQYLVRALVEYAQSHPKAIFDAEVFHVWTLGVAPYTDEKFKYNFRHNSFFIGPNTREAVNQGVADYTPIFLSHVPRLFARGLVPIDVALIQTSPPDRHGYMSLGVSVDITKAATERASLVIAQVNSFMPRVHGDGFIHIEDVDFIVPYDEPLLEFRAEVDNEIAQQIGKYVARIIQDGDTIQVGYGSIPNAILANLSDKKHLGVHTELLSDGIVALMKKGVIDNSRKTINRGKTVATFCMGTRETYEYLDDNPAIEFRTVDYTNNPLVIARLDNMTAINSALEIDLTGQASAESLGRMFFSGIGGQADFMRGAVLARNGKTILALPSTAHNETV